MLFYDRGEAVEVVRRHLRRRGLPLVFADELVDVFDGELRRQHGRRVRRGLVRARRFGGGRAGRPRGLTQAQLVELRRCAVAGVSYGELAECYGLSVSTIGRYLRDEV